MITALMLIAGLVMLYVGAEALVRGSSRIAVSLGISPLVVGLTIVAFGTSAPELAVGIGAAVSGHPDVAFGNVVGSNICNTLLILGLAAAIAPISIAARLVRWDVPIMIGVSGLVWIMAAGGLIGRGEGFLLVALLAGYLVLCGVLTRRENAKVQKEYAREYGKTEGRRAGSLLIYALLTLAGLALLVAGADIFVKGAVMLARVLGMSELVIGLTVVAIGTSLPEIATSIVAACRRETDIAAGNIVGSNIFNLLAVLGAAGIASPSGIGISRAALAFDVPVMFAAAVACLPIFFTGHRISRREGIAFTGFYSAYITLLILDARGNTALPMLRSVVLFVVFPIAAITLAVFAIREWRNRTSSA